MSARDDWTEEELEREYVSKMTAVTIPVNIRIKGQHRILDLSEMKKIITESRLISLGKCGCRKDMKRCNAPLDVCISLDKEAEDMIEKGLAKKANLEEVLKALERSHTAGLVHIAYTFEGNEKPDVVCSCCSCCCHSMSALVRFGIPDAVVMSNYVAVNNQEACTNCGTCVGRCQFKARRLENGKLTYNRDRCFGCGVCVSTCPTKSISLVKRSWLTRATCLSI
jgi:Pyruvate/2-oxoacid:ferredoxin oxidoreductase delta subunit